MMYVVQFLECGECYREIEDGQVTQVIYCGECEEHGNDGHG